MENVTVSPAKEMEDVTIDASSETGNKVTRANNVTNLRTRNEKKSLIGA